MHIYYHELEIFILIDTISQLYYNPSKKNNLRIHRKCFAKPMHNGLNSEDIFYFLNVLLKWNKS